MEEKEFASPVNSRTTRDIGPILPQERVDVVDILRGFAIFGMLVVNFSHDLSWHYLFARLWPGTADRVAYFVVLFFATAKFHTLFSFLFGLGFALQMGRAEARGVRFFPLYARRLFVLLLLGLTNWVFWDSTLVDYALLGYLLFLFRGCSPKTVLAAAFLFACYWPVADGVVGHIHARRLADPRTANATKIADAKAEAEKTAEEQEDLRVNSQGSFSEIVVHDARDVISNLSSGYFYLEELGYPFPLLLLGLYVGRRRILQDIPAHVVFIRRVFWWGLGLGLAGNAVGVLLSDYPGFYTAPWTGLRGLALVTIGPPALCFFYASAVVLLVQKPAWKLRLARLIPVGRMALSNYFLQVLIFKAIFESYGLGFYGRMGPLLGVGVALPVFLLQVLLSTWWMKHFRFGPAEWLWRTLTYGKLQPMRLAAAG